MLAPQTSGYASGPGFPSFTIPQSIPAYLSTPNKPETPLPSGSTFRAPAHKHAHHLHSIPPREKSTRTLIIDHMLWVHGRTRFAQARAELGMTDRTGGPSSPNYAHRRRPENYEEDADENSEGEEPERLKSRTGDPRRIPANDEEDRLNSQDLPLARSLRLRAEGLEKVVTSMLAQPPAFHPTNDDDIWTPPTSPEIIATNQPHHNPHTLPNGVRLRLALGTIINDLFARQAPPPPYRHHIHSKSPSESPADSPTSSTPTELPAALKTLSVVSATNTLPHSLSRRPSPSANIPGYGSQSNLTNHSMHLNARTSLLYNTGTDTNTANSPPSLRCPRHLYTSCDICIEARTSTRSGMGSRPRNGSFADYRSGQRNARKGMSNGVGPSGGRVTGWQDSSGIGSGLLRPGVHGSCLRRKSNGLDEPGSSTGSGNTKLSELIPRFIRLSALVAVELAMEAKDAQDGMNPSISKETAQDLLHPIEREWPQFQHPPTQATEFSLLPDPLSSATIRAVVQSQDKASDLALRPTREWYLLLAGLLTRAALEGYLTAGWRGTHAIECLMTVGLGPVEYQPLEQDMAGGFTEFEPDGLPSLLEATKLLFPNCQSPHIKGHAEEEYEVEMRERLRRFYDIPASTPDLSTHMEDLAWQYPAEPVERAAVRFCEAIAKWRGKPELETYKKPVQPPAYRYAQDIAGTSSLPMESLVHSNPPTPTLAHPVASARPRRPRRKPFIGAYFTQPQPSPFQEAVWNPNPRPSSIKRMRSSEDTRPSPPKRLNLG